MGRPRRHGSNARAARDVQRGRRGKGLRRDIGRALRRGEQFHRARLQNHVRPASLKDFKHRRGHLLEQRQVVVAPLKINDRDGDAVFVGFGWINGDAERTG